MPGVGEASVALPPPTNGHAPSLEILGADVPTQLGGCTYATLRYQSIRARCGCGGGSSNGQMELGEFVLGLPHARSGSVRVLSDVLRGSPGRILRLGVACVPEDPSDTERCRACPFSRT